MGHDDDEHEDYYARRTARADAAFAVFCEWAVIAAIGLMIFRLLT
jgi:hypothetical protein